jgi:hypothetical protein
MIQRTVYPPTRSSRLSVQLGHFVSFQKFLQSDLWLDRARPLLYAVCTFNWQLHKNTTYFSYPLLTTWPTVHLPPLFQYTTLSVTCCISATCLSGATKCWPQPLSITVLGLLFSGFRKVSLRILFNGALNCYGKTTSVMCEWINKYRELVKFYDKKNLSQCHFSTTDPAHTV